MRADPEPGKNVLFTNSQCSVIIRYTSNHNPPTGFNGIEDALGFARKGGSDFRRAAESAPAGNPIISRIPGALSTERSHAGFAAIDKASFDRTRLASGDVTLYWFHQVMAAATRREIFRRSPVPNRRTQAR
jgi:hypothetical protein